MGAWGVVLLWLGMAVGVAILADTRGRSPLGFFLLSLVLTPLLGLIVCLVARNLATAPAVAVVGPAPSVADELGKLAALHGAGHLTDAEFAQHKQRLLDGR